MIIPPTIQIRHAVHWWRSEDELGYSSMDHYTWTCQYWLTNKNLHHLCGNTRCSLEDLRGAMNDRDGWRERERKKESGKSVLSARLNDEDDEVSRPRKRHTLFCWKFWEISNALLGITIKYLYGGWKFPKKKIKVTKLKLNFFVKK